MLYTSSYGQANLSTRTKYQPMLHPCSDTSKVTQRFLRVYADKSGFSH